MTVEPPTGRQELRGGQPHLVLTRRFRAPIQDVWAAITEPERLARWIGTWTGDPAVGRVEFRMLFEDQATAEQYRIDACHPPRRLAVTTESPDGGDDPAWHLELDLAEADGFTTLTFAQSVPDPRSAEHIGPGWEYYLDRLVAAQTDSDPAAVTFGRYYPAMSAYYRDLFVDDQG